MKHLIIMACMAFSASANAQYKRGASTNYHGYHRPHPTLYIIDGVQIQNIGEEANVDIPDNVNNVEVKMPLLPAIPNTITLTRRDVNAISTASIRDIAALAPTVYQVRRGSDIIVAGSRPHDVLYVIDGMHIPRN